MLDDRLFHRLLSDFGLLSLLCSFVWCWRRGWQWLKEHVRKLSILGIKTEDHLDNFLPDIMAAEHVQHLEIVCLCSRILLR